MKKELLQNQSGFSLLSVIFAIALVSSGTYYVMDISKQNKKSASKARATTALEAEKKRLSTILSDSAHCTENFARGAYSRSDITALHYKPVSASLINFLTTGVQPQSRLNLSSIVLSFTPGQPNSGNLRLSYDTATFVGESQGKKYSVIDIPLYILLDASNKVSSCYAITENSKVGLAIQAACQNSDTNYSYYNLAGGITNSCSTNFTLPIHPVTQKEERNCQGLGNGLKLAIHGYNIVNQPAPNVGNTIEIPTDKCEGFTSTIASDVACPLDGQRAFGVSAGVIQCDFPGNNHEAPMNCPAGQLVNKTSGTTTTCFNANCPAPSFVRAIDGSTGSVSCTTPSTYTCGAGQWARAFNANGTPDCAPMPSMNGSCSGGFGDYILRDVGTNDGTLHCSAYTIAKACPANQYMTSFTNGSPNCVPF